MVGYLRDKDFTVLVLQPLQVKAYARVHLRRAKNDKLDAVLIAACTATIDQPRIEPDGRLAKLAQHLTFVEQIEEGTSLASRSGSNMSAKRGCAAWAWPTSPA